MAWRRSSVRARHGPPTCKLGKPHNGSLRLHRSLIGGNKERKTGRTRLSFCLLLVKIDGTFLEIVDFLFVARFDYVVVFDFFLINVF